MEHLRAPEGWSYGVWDPGAGEAGDWVRDREGRVQRFAYEVGAVMAADGRPGARVEPVAPDERAPGRPTNWGQ